jgi:hypothetical protein
MIADYTQALGGKLYIMGGGFGILFVPAAGAIGRFW